MQNVYQNAFTVCLHPAVTCFQQSTQYRNKFTFAVHCIKRYSWQNCYSEYLDWKMNLFTHPDIEITISNHLHQLLYLKNNTNKK